MIERLKGKENLVKFALLLVAAMGIYLLVAWASYSPLDNAWSVASSVADKTLNRAGELGAWLIDLLFSAFGNVAFIVPFALFAVPVYLIVSKSCEELTVGQIAFWILSFTLLMFGLSGVSHVILSNSATYLSGGFIGAILSDLVGAFGTFGTLFVAMICIAVGFYFCSGQIILQLFNRLFNWITENKDEGHSVKVTQQAVSSDENLANLNAENHSAVQAKENVINETAFTDVSIFTRPKITGLKTEEQPKPTKLTDVSMFRVEENLDLPKVTVPERETVQVLQNAPVLKPQIVLQSEPVVEREDHFPTVRLNSSNQAVVGEEQIENAQMRVEIESLVEDEEPHIPQVTIPEVKIEQPEFLKPTTKVAMPEPVAQAVNSVQNVTQNYPKGYGDSLIHPLLQRKKIVEKPTTPLPTLDLLQQTLPETQKITEQEILETSEKIEQELANFGVKATVEDVLVGPVVTRYEIKPAAGVKASKVTNLESDLARALIFQAIRITDVVPGKPYMGIETPNSHRETVWLRDVFDSDEFRYSKAILPMALGKDISGKPIVVDMAKMPHLLVAGQTGGGKSVGVNTMILSLLFKLTPEQVRFIMIDPKVVELSIYNDIPHLLTPVVTDMKQAENALRWAVEEMERRYLLVSSLGVRNIEGFNSKIDQAEEMQLPIPNPLWRPGDTMDALPPPLEKLSYIVLIVDEFADLMMSAGKQVEDHIMRIAQKARAVGIHLILATQRPSTDVITGVIKANIPSRIAFTVASQIDSRTILDKGGAESLLGRGDMLYSGAGSPDIIRIHGAFMTDDDVQRVADNWRARGKPEYIEKIIESADENDVDGSGRSAGGDLDPLFDEITQYVIDSEITSISGIQRRFSLGFNRAARIVDQLEEQGILSAPDSRGKREILAR